MQNNPYYEERFTHACEGGKVIQLISSKLNITCHDVSCELFVEPPTISAMQIQHRMCAPIMELSNALIYGDRLRCGSPDVANVKHEYMFVIVAKEGNSIYVTVMFICFIFIVNYVVIDLKWLSPITISDHYNNK